MLEFVGLLKYESCFVFFPEGDKKLCNFLSEGSISVSTSQTDHCCTFWANKCHNLRSCGFPFSLFLIYCALLQSVNTHAVSVDHYRFLRKTGITTPRTNRSDVNTNKNVSSLTIFCSRLCGLIFW